MSVRSTLVLDIGSGTQDVLYFLPDREPENCPKFVLPAPARQVGARIRRLTSEGRGIYLFGTNMGGGFHRDVMAHVKAGLPIAAHPEAAYSIADDLTALEAKGVTLAETCPPGHVAVRLADYDAGYWNALLAAAGLEMPYEVMACAQDHGFHPGQSNRMGRFALWRRFLLEAEGRPEALVYEHPPHELTRLAALQRSIGGGLVADSGAAAVLGALSDPEVAERSRHEGLCLVNVGNSHTIAFLLFRERMWGVYEHHTGLLDEGQLWSELNAFRRGELGFEAVFEGNGHGCMTPELPAEAHGFLPTVVLGPRRSMLAHRPVLMPAPGGDMMLAGCFGLLKGRELRGGGG
ncbi:MAG: DUF1786 domain-containing protein [Desulfocurvibacter africanus]